MDVNVICIRRVIVSVLAFMLMSAAFSHAVTQDSLLIIRENGREFEHVSGLIRDELQSDFVFHDLIISRKSSPSEIQNAVGIYNPKLVILMDNKSIDLYMQYQFRSGDSLRLIPSISIMGVLVEDAITDIKNAAGISYEVPALTSILAFKSVVKMKIINTGVIHREFLKGFIDRNINICRKKGINLESISLPNKSSKYPYAIKKAIEELIELKDVNCLWIPNDNVLLCPEYVEKIWSPVLLKYKIPVIVGVESLVNPDLHFGSFAVLPDHSALGNQVAGMVYEIQKNDWSVKQNSTEPPLAVIKVINYRLVKTEFGVKENSLRSIDRVLK